MNVKATISRTKAVRLAAVMMLGLMIALPLSSAYLNENIDMTGYVEDRSCYCHGPQPADNVSITIDVPTQVAYTPSNDTVSVRIGIEGEPNELTGFGLFLNASEDGSGLRWTKRFANDTLDLGDGTIEGIIRVNGTSMWTTDDMTSSWFNVTFIPGLTDQDIVLSVTGMKSNGNDNDTGDFWNVGEVTIEVRRQRLVTINVGVSNEEQISVREVLVDFYIDGELIGNSSVPHIPAGGTENATISWDATFAKEGKHKLRAVIDPLGQVTEIDKANNEVTQDIWLGGPPEPEDLTIYYGLGGMAAGVVVIVVVFWFWRRRQYRF